MCPIPGSLHNSVWGPRTDQIPSRFGKNPDLGPPQMQRILWDSGCGFLPNIERIWSVLGPHPSVVVHQIYSLVPRALFETNSSRARKRTNIFDMEEIRFGKFEKNEIFEKKRKFWKIWKFSDFMFFRFFRFLKFFIFSRKFYFSRFSKSIFSMMKKYFSLRMFCRS